MEIIPNVYIIPTLASNAYLLIDPDGLTLIDTGIPGSHKKILGYLAELGFAAGDLKRILITHADYDHVGGLAALRAACGARVYASLVEAQAIGLGLASRPLKPRSWLARLLFLLVARLFRSTPTRVDEYLANGDVLPALGGLHVLNTSGHTPGHVSFYAPALRILFCGDSLIPDGTGLRGSRGANNWDQAKSDAALRKQAALSVDIVCSGHRQVVYEAAGKFPGV